MAIAFRASSSGDPGNLSGTTTVTVTKPTGTASTDVLVAVFGFGAGGSANLTAPSGWTSVATGAGNTTEKLSCWWALGSVASLGFSWSSSTGQGVGWAVAAFTGVDNTTPVDATGTTATATATGSVAAPAVTIATANAWELIAATDWNNGAISATGFTAAANGNPAANQDACLLYNTTPKAAGSTGTVTVSTTGPTSGQILIVIPFALRPSGGAAAAVYVPRPFPSLPGGILAQ